MVSIRELAENEQVFLMEMLYESMYIPEEKPPKEVLLKLPHLKNYSEGWGRKGDRALIAINNDDEAIGAAWYRLFSETEKGYGFVDVCIPELGIALKEEARGMGAGTKLMEAILLQAKRDGYAALSLSVDPANHQAVHLYKKLGFIECGASGTSITMLCSLAEKS
ncbi:GNAT family N-acetyltransferase [Heyndrickxia acidicola]|uniref:GNAT family N-acetyltransferase n=1 Tax=Heyndrickxia acidicola TaxID=209389 RepID=A0ABU6MN15_9BACI|nr:GNAT family N-acetyltransferase [Heyndrickxia acidicola]MED1204450.1 GNAT family N-acetyltransferase [Heyndrickxia acidicola]